MNASQVLSRSWKILWSYRILWLLGFILALTTVSFEAMLLSGGDDWQSQSRGIVIRGEDFDASVPGINATFDFTPEYGFNVIISGLEGDPVVFRTVDGFSIELPRAIERDLEELDQLFSGELPADVDQFVVGALVTILAVLAMVVLAATVARYVTEAALIGSVDDYAETGEKSGIGRMLRLGFSRTAWRLFLIDLLIRVPAMVLVAFLFFLSITPLLLWITGEAGAVLFSTLLSAALFVGTVILAVALGLVVTLVTQFVRRACALEDLPVTAAIGRGFRIVRSNFRDVMIMAVFMLGAGIGWYLLLIALAFVLIPLTLVFVILGALAAIAVLFPVAGLSGLVLNDVVAWTLAGSLALAIFIPIVVAPFLFLRGLLEVFRSSAWTLTYRELLSSKPVQEEAAPKGLLAKA